MPLKSRTGGLAGGRGSEGDTCRTGRRLVTSAAALDAKYLFYAVTSTGTCRGYVNAGSRAVNKLMDLFPLIAYGVGHRELRDGRPSIEPGRTLGCDVLNTMRDPVMPMPRSPSASCNAPG